MIEFRFCRTAPTDAMVPTVVRLISAQLAASLRLRKPSEHNYTPRSSTADGSPEALTSLEADLRAAGVAPEALFAALAAVLHLGDVRFAGDEGGASVEGRGVGKQPGTPRAAALMSPRHASDRGKVSERRSQPS